jgi:hypothetical protein
MCGHCKATEHSPKLVTGALSGMMHAIHLRTLVKQTTYRAKLLFDTRLIGSAVCLDGKCSWLTGITFEKRTGFVKWKLSQGAKLSLRLG